MCYNACINKNIQILMAKLNKVLEMLDCKWHDIKDKADLLVCLANQLWRDDFTNTSYYFYLTNNFDLEEPKIYKKAIASNQIEE